LEEGDGPFGNETESIGTRNIQIIIGISCSNQAEKAQNPKKFFTFHSHEREVNSFNKTKELKNLKIPGKKITVYTSLIYGRYPHIINVKFFFYLP